MDEDFVIDARSEATRRQRRGLYSEQDAKPYPRSRTWMAVTLPHTHTHAIFLPSPSFLKEPLQGSSRSRETDDTALYLRSSFRVGFASALMDLAIPSCARTGEGDIKKDGGNVGQSLGPTANPELCPYVERIVWFAYKIT